MLLISKESKQNKIRTKYFPKVVVISSTLSTDKNNDIPTLPLPVFLPPTVLFKQLAKKEISKSKFNKKYMDYLNNDQMVECTFFNLILAMEKSNICFITSDAEWATGFAKTFVKFIEKKLGVHVFRIGEFEKEISKMLETNLTKKERKDKDKVKKAIKSFIKEYDEDKENNMSIEGKSYFNGLRKKYAVDQLITAAVASGICDYGTDNVINITGKLKKVKVKQWVSGIIASANSGKKYKKIIGKVLERHDLKLKGKKKLNKLTKEQIIHLCAEIAMELNKFRVESFAE